MEQIVMMDRAQLRESPFNPRKLYNAAGLAELADTMRAPDGRVHSPLVVRPVDQADIEHTHEIVFGHRRFRAAALADLAEVPVIVRDMTEQEARIAQLIENSQREDVSPLEEADSLNELRHRHGMPIEDLMKRTGKSRRYVFATLKLATAHDDVRAALASGLIGSEIAKMLASVPIVLQPKALEDVTHSQHVQEADGVWRNRRMARSARETKNILEQRYRLKLSTAPFDVLSIKLIPGVLACDACPKRSDNEPVLLEDCGADVCTDPDCFSAKKVANAELELASARKLGISVIEGEAAEELLAGPWDNNPEGYVPLDRKSGQRSLAGVELTYGDLLANMGKKAPKTTFIVHPFRAGEIIKCLPTARLADIRIGAGSTTPIVDKVEEQGSRWEREEEQRKAEEAKLTPEQRAVWDGNSWKAVRLAMMRRVLATPRTAGELRAFLKRELSIADEFGLAEVALGWEFDDDNNDIEAREAKLDAMSGDQLGALLVMLAIEDDTGGFRFGESREQRVADRLARAAHYGVDVLNPTSSPPTPPTAARAHKEAPTKGVVKFRNPMTGETWSGSGLQPKWMKAALASGKTLADFEVARAAQGDFLAPLDASQTVDAGCAGEAGAQADLVNEEVVAS